MQNPEKVQNAVSSISKRTSSGFRPKIGLILGTGLGGLVESIEPVVSLPYSEIEGFVGSTVVSHAGRLTGGYLRSRPVWAMEGRFHLYEGYSPEDAVLGVRALAGLGVEKLIITNAVGGLNPLFEPGSIMLVTDQINLTGRSPLCGPNHDPWGPRFPDMSRAFSPALAKIAAERALELSIPLERGVYVGVSGPNLETPAETRAFRILGGDAIGMSLVLETIAARHMGLEVLGLSVVTNLNLPDCMAETSVEEIIEVANKGSARLAELISAVVESL